MQSKSESTTLETTEAISYTEHVHHHDSHTSNSLPLPLINPNPLPPPNNLSPRYPPPTHPLSPSPQLPHIHRLLQSNQLIKVPMRSMTHQRLQPSIMHPLYVLHILEPSLHGLFTDILRIAIFLHQIHITRRNSRSAAWNLVETAMENYSRDRQVGVFAEQDVLLCALYAVPGEVWEAVF